LARLAQRGGRCPIPGNIQGQVGWGSEQPDVVEDVPAHCSGVGLHNVSRSLPTQTILSFYDYLFSNTKNQTQYNTICGKSSKHLLVNKKKAECPRPQNMMLESSLCHVIFRKSYRTHKLKC